MLLRSYRVAILRHGFSFVESPFSQGYASDAVPSHIPSDPFDDSGFGRPRAARGFVYRSSRSTREG